MTREEKLKKIYDKVWTTKSRWNDLAVYAATKFWMNKAWPIMQGIVEKFDELCWPKVMIGDVIEYIFEQEEVTQSEWYTITNMIIWERDEIRYAIDDQNQECIDYVLSFIEMIDDRREKSVWGTS